MAADYGTSDGHVVICADQGGYWEWNVGHKFEFYYTCTCRSQTTDCYSWFFSQYIAV